MRRLYFLLFGLVYLVLGIVVSIGVDMKCSMSFDSGVLLQGLILQRESIVTSRGRESRNKALLLNRDHVLRA